MDVNKQHDFSRGIDDIMLLQQRLYFETVSASHSVFTVSDDVRIANAMTSISIRAHRPTTIPYVTSTT